MGRSISCLALAAALGLCLAGPAAAQRLVPPGNSAVNQYTETYPTAEGGAPAGDTGKRSPAESLGARNAGRLEALGPEGRAAAEAAAATAPDSKRTGTAGGAGKGEGAAGEPSGSSGLREVLGQATGTSSGELGLLLPLAILAAVAGSLAFLWRRGRRTA